MPLTLVSATEFHRCRWPGCEQLVSPILWGCRVHWYALPAHLRGAIRRTFVLGEEPSRAHAHALRCAEDWIREHVEPEPEPPRAA